MVRPKKDAPVEVAAAPSSEEAGETKKAAGRGKRKGKTTTGAPLVKRMLRSNSKPTVEESSTSTEKEVKSVSDGKSARKPTGKGKKAAEPIGASGTNGNNSDNDTAADDEKVTKVVESVKKAEKASKGKKKAATSNGKLVTDEAQKEESTETNETETANAETTKPVKSGGGKKKQDVKENRM